MIVDRIFDRKIANYRKGFASAEGGATIVLKHTLQLLLQSIGELKIP
jgi:hypothetical protein